MGCSPRGYKESDTTERLFFHPLWVTCLHPLPFLIRLFILLYCGTYDKFAPYSRQPSTSPLRAVPFSSLMEKETNIS